MADKVKNINELLPDCGKCVWSRIIIEQTYQDYGGKENEFCFGMECLEPQDTGKCRITINNMTEVSESTNNYNNIVAKDVWKIR